MPEPQWDVTALLDAWSDGDPEALERLIPLVFDDLRRLARIHLSKENPGHTLQPTALVNEVYLRVASRQSVHWESRAQFFAGMAEIMRRVLVDHARRRKALKKGGGVPTLPFDEQLDSPTSGAWTSALGQIDIDLVALDTALRGLAKVDPRQARIVELRYFGGLTIEETAATLDISAMTVKRAWRSARLWLLRALDGP